MKKLLIYQVDKFSDEAKTILLDLVTSIFPIFKGKLAISVNDITMDNLLFVEKLVQKGLYYIILTKGASYFQFPIDSLHLEGIKQYYVDIEKEEWKVDTLQDLFEVCQIVQSIVYCNENKALWLQEELRKRDFRVFFFFIPLIRRLAFPMRSMNLERVVILKAFAYNDKGSSRLMILDDTFSCAYVDVGSVSCVVSYDCPSSGSILKKVNYFLQ